MDIYSKQKRTEIMSKISGKNSQPEIVIRKLIFMHGYRFRIHKKGIPGKPDIVFPKYKKVIFINGCFWHGHNGCKRSTLPASNTDFWKEKITNNKKRDKNNYTKLTKLGWEYLVVWQCTINKKNLPKLEKKILYFLSQ